MAASTLWCQRCAHTADVQGSARGGGEGAAVFALVLLVEGMGGLGQVIAAGPGACRWEQTWAVNVVSLLGRGTKRLCSAGVLHCKVGQGALPCAASKGGGRQRLGGTWGCLLARVRGVGFVKRN